jgi:hypothetical protein
MRTMRTMIALGIMSLLLVLGAGSASAVAAKFHSTDSSVNNGGALVVSWDERGVGNGNIDYLLTADATALYACLNGGGNHPQAANKEAFNGSLSTGGSFESMNGRVQASLMTGPLQAPSFTCPSGQTRVLAAVSYTNIVLTDLTNGTSVQIEDASRVFFNV